MDRLEEIRTMILNVLEEGPMPGNVLMRKIFESHQHVIYYEPNDMVNALYLSYSEGYIERFVKNDVTCYRINDPDRKK
jgi:DNA-binding PadR family transcriptional regulator